MWYHLLEPGALDTPCLILYKDRIQYNINTMVRVAGDPRRLMPHVKTCKITEIVRMQMNTGIQRFKCATIAEAEMLGMAGAENVLLAFQPSRIKLKRLTDLIMAYPQTKYSTLVDNIDTAKMMDHAFQDLKMGLDVYIDINNGNNRTGISPENAYDLYLFMTGLRALNVTGMHVYDGHIRNTDPSERKKICDRDFEPVEKLRKRIIREKNIHPEVVAGGSLTFSVHAERKEVICSPGTTLLWDAGYGETFPDLPYIPAAVLLTRVVSLPAEDILCLDLGHKAVASENSIDRRIRFLNIDNLEPVSHSEEHLVVRNRGSQRLGPGDLLYGIPYHICPTTALHEEVPVIENHLVVDHWKVIARKRKINY